MPRLFLAPIASLLLDFGFFRLPETSQHVTPTPRRTTTAAAAATINIRIQDEEEEEGKRGEGTFSGRSIC